MRVYQVRFNFRYMLPDTNVEYIAVGTFSTREAACAHVEKMIAAARALNPHLPPIKSPSQKLSADRTLFWVTEEPPATGCTQVAYVESWVLDEPPMRWNLPEKPDVGYDRGALSLGRLRTILFEIET